MHNKRIIITGIAVFLVLALYPVWNTIFTDMKKPPQLEIPKDRKECVMPVAYMKENHMVLLKEWRDKVVREGDRSPVTVSGVKYEKNLNTCFACHERKSAFCDRCHENLSVYPSCWDCHQLPKEKKVE